jgi:hypothetical protein
VTFHWAEEENMSDEWGHCPTCGLANEHAESVRCSNLWHLTGENRIPEPKPWRPSCCCEPPDVYCGIHQSDAPRYYEP